MLHAQTAIRTGCDPACFFDLTRCRSGVGGLRGGVRGEGLAECLCLLRRVFDGLADGACGGHWARVAAPWLEVLGEQFDEVGGEEADHAPVALQTAHPPRAIARVEALDQVSFYEAEVAFRLQSVWSVESTHSLSRAVTHLSAPRVHGLAPAREARGQAWSSGRHGHDVRFSEGEKPVALRSFLWRWRR